MFNSTQTVLITGASSGIGEAFAEKFASLGLTLILVARREDRLKEIATRLVKKYSVKCEVIALDLTAPDAVNKLLIYIHTINLKVDVLVNNAGFSTHGQFDQINPRADHQLIQLNVSVLTDLCHAFLPNMRKNQFGVVINLGSTTSFFPLPQQAVYAASKAYVLSLSEALWYEYQHTGVKVIALCPGATQTEFFDVMGKQLKENNKAKPSDVVETALNALLYHNKPSVIHGFNNTIQARGLTSILPKKWLTCLVGKVSKNVYQ